MNDLKFDYGVFVPREFIRITYKTKSQVIWSYPDQFSNVILRLGGMHLLMSFVGAVGTHMADSGLSEILSTAFAGVPKLLNGKKFPQNVCVPFDLLLKNC